MANVQGYLMAAICILFVQTSSQTLVQRAAVGGSVKLHCPPSTESNTNQFWRHNGLPVANSSRAHLVGSNLHLENLQRIDDGLYECVDDNESIIAASTLQVIWLTSVTVRRESAHLKQPSGHTPTHFFLVCHVDASDAPTIEWQLNGHPIEPALDHPTESPDRLYFNQPTPDQDGVYSCSATNLAGTMYSKHNFTVGNGHAKFARKHKRAGRRASHQMDRSKRGGASVREVDENGTGLLNCEMPKGGRSNGLVVQWLKDGKILRQVDINADLQEVAAEAVNNENVMPREDHRVSANPKNGTLTLTPVMPSDTGLYECLVFKEATTGVPFSSKKTELKVIEQLKFVPQPASKNLELGSTAKVHCKVQGTPTPTVTWTRGGISLPADASVTDTNGTLVFRNVSQSDKGNYTCEATNVQGSILAEITIDVIVAPRFVVAPVGPINAVEMDSVMIHCQATGDPMPTIQWDKDLQYLSNHNESTDVGYRILENGTLHILEVHPDDEGRYGCTIGSSVGLKREEVQMSVRAADETVAEESGDGFMITRAVLITMSVAFAYIILVVGLMLWCRLRRKARKARMHLLDKDATENGGTGAHDEIKLDEVEPCLPANKTKKTNGVHNKHRGESGTHESNNDTAASTNSKVSKKSSNFDSITLARACLTDLVQIGQGDFGDVLVGKVLLKDLRKDIEDDLKADSENSKKSLDDINVLPDANEDPSLNQTRDVLVKALNKVKDETVCIEFRRQIEMFRTISHKNVSKLYGLCRDQDPHYLVLEYTDLGDLKEYLGKHRGSATLTRVQMLRMAWQIGRGMDAIYRARYIHKDLAARNCLIDRHSNVKISYPALHKDKYADEYYKLNNTVVPLRWLAPECLHDDDYSTKSDVFAYGVLMWEMLSTSGGLPMAHHTNEEYAQKLKDSTLDFQVAEETPTDLVTVLTSCWNLNPKERPSFHTLHTAIGNTLQLLEKAADTTTASAD